MWLTRLLVESWNILAESAAFILVGFGIAGLLHVAMSKGNWTKWLKGLGARSVVLASAVGLPLPLCSCSVLPAAVSLRKNGASKGATLSFLISTPETSVQSVLLTYALLGPVMAIFRPIASCITALTAGLIENFFERRFPAPAAAGDPDLTPEEAAGCCAHEEPPPPTCCEPGDSELITPEAAPRPHPLRAGMRHAFVDIFDDVVGWMLLGVFVAAAIQVAVPGFLIESVFGPPLQAMLIMLVIGIPLYVCAEASTPIAAALIVQGVSPGAAFVFLLAGPATNIGAVGLLSRQLGRRTVVIYLATIAAVSVIFGLLLDWVFGLRGVNLSERALAEPFLPAWIKHGGAALFVLLTVFSMIRLRAYQRFAGLLDRALPMRITPSRLTVTLIVVAMVAWFASGLAAVQPGQVGMIKQFGRVVAADVPPGLHYVWPYPIGSLDRIETREVHRLELGVSSTAQTAEDAEDDRSWVLLGDENIANIKCAAHWRMAAGQSRAFAYSTFDRELLVASAVRTALRGVLGGANIDTVFTTEQVSLSEKIHREAQHILDRSDCGIELVAFAFLDLHAPPQVHEAFRDVASALEDRATRRNQALTRQAEIEPLARGTREKLIRAARGDGLRLLGEAAGEADAFRDTLAAYEEFPYITRARMTFEMYDRILPGRRKFIRPASEHLQLDLRFRSGRTAGEGAMP